MLEEVSELFGIRDSAQGEAVRWAQEPFIGGTYVVFEPGQLVRHGPHLRRAHDRVYFAAAERSSWPDSMEGAVESASRAVERVTGVLGR
jgi:monoamine oxidase